MFRSNRPFSNAALATPLAAILLATVSVNALSPLQAENASTQPAANPPVAFAHTQSDLAVDPAARFGTLPNGMTYVIYRNATPPGAASVWMRVAAGSLMEQENQRGLAHFLEHMAFNGSKNLPEGEMVKLLERGGLQFGADTNAQTSDSETLYTLNLPQASERVVSDALFVMRETAGNLLLDPGAIDRERGVILGEERARASTEMRAYEAEAKQLFPGLKYPERMPIGLIDVIQTAQRPAFVQFYNDFYRPEYTTLIVAGDIDPDKIESEIRRRFSDWRPPARSPAARTDFGVLVPRREPEAKAFIAEGLRDAISVTWVTPPVDAIETKAKDLEDALYGVAAAIIGERFGRAADTSDSAFIGAGFQRQDIQHTARLHALNITPKDGKEQGAFEQAMMILREFVANGPTQAELDRALLRFDRVFTERAAAARTISTQEIAQQILKAVGERRVLQSPAQELAEFREMKPAITVAVVTAALKQMPLGGAPLLWLQGSKATPFDAPAMIAAYRAVTAAPVTAAAARASVNWPYTDFGTPSAIVSRTTMPDVGATRVTFANGVVLTVKQTRFEDNAVNVIVQLGNGLRGISRDQGADLFMAKQAGLLPGGLGKLSSDDINEALAGKIFGLNFSIDTNATTLSGGTTKSDLAVQMQVLAAFITDPGFRPDVLDRVKASVASTYANARTDPEGVYFLEASGDPYDDDPRFSPPSLDAGLAVSPTQVTALTKNQIGHGPVEVTIIGDVTVDEAVRQVGASLGALPPFPAAVGVPGADAVRFPTRDLHRVYTHEGRADQNLSVIAWPTNDYYADPRSAAALDLLAAVMTMREREEVREKQGASYSASASSTMSRYFPGFGYILSRATVKADGDDAYYKTVAAIAGRLKRRPVTADELARVRGPMIQHLHAYRNTNNYWVSLLSGVARDPRHLASFQAYESNLLAVTAKDIRRQAGRYLDMSKALRIQIAPKPEPAKGD